MAAALDGINLIEFGANLGAEYAAWLLAEQGAHAIKIEPPGGSLRRGTPHFHALNRSKRSRVLDPNASEARAEIERLARWADLFITGFTPARALAYGVDYETLRSYNPRLVVVNVPPLGGRGPDADLESNDDLAAAMGGITGSQWARSGDPIALGFPAASYSAGMLAACAAVAALCARGDGEGQAAEVSLLAGAFSLQTGGIIRHEKMTALYRGPLDPLGPIPCYRLFEASDGKYFFAACGNATFWGKFALALERADLVSDPRFENAPWGIPPQNWQTLVNIIEPIVRTRPREEWLAILRETDVPCAPVMSRREFIDWEQPRALGLRREIDDPTLGATVQMGLPIFLNDTPGAITGPAPALGDSRDALAWLASPGAGAPPAAGRKPASHGRGPLDGIVVLDFASYIAGSYGPMLLAQLGASVIKIESLEGDSFRHFGFGFLGWNQGKRGLALDLGSPQGREIALGLADRADIAVENLRPGRMRRFGLDYQALAARNPGIIYMSVNGFGNRGPEHNQPGFDPLLQARSGVMAAQGGHREHPVYLTCAICDYGAAMLSALGCVLALRARGRTGRGQFCETSLIQAALAMQAGEFIFYEGRPDLEDGEVERRGSGALSRAYRCRDGKWLFISLEREGEWDTLRSLMSALPTLDFHGASQQPVAGELAAVLEARFAERDCADALAQLRGARIPAAPVHHMDDLLDDPHVAANDLIAEVSHREWGKVRQTGILMKFSATPGRVERAAPLLGEHTDEILREYLGYDALRIQSLRAAGVIK